MHGAVRSGRNAEQRAQDSADQHEPQAHEHSTSELVVDRRVVDRAAEIAARHAADPASETRRERCLVVHVDGVQRGVDDGRRRRGIPAFVTRAGMQLRSREQIGHGRGDNDEHQEIGESTQ